MTRWVPQHDRFFRAARCGEIAMSLQYYAQYMSMYFNTLSPFDTFWYLLAIWKPCAKARLKISSRSSDVIKRPIVRDCPRLTIHAFWLDLLWSAFLPLHPPFTLVMRKSMEIHKNPAFHSQLQSVSAQRWAQAFARRICCYIQQPT